MVCLENNCKGSYAHKYDQHGDLDYKNVEYKRMNGIFHCPNYETCHSIYSSKKKFKLHLDACLNVQKIFKWKDLTNISEGSPSDWTGTLRGTDFGSKESFKVVKKVLIDLS